MVRLNLNMLVKANLSRPSETEIFFSRKKRLTMICMPNSYLILRKKNTKFYTNLSEAKAYQKTKTPINNIFAYSNWKNNNMNRQVHKPSSYHSKNKESPYLNPYPHLGISYILPFSLQSKQQQNLGTSNSLSHHWLSIMLTDSDSCSQLQPLKLIQSAIDQPEKQSDPPSSGDMYKTETYAFNNLNLFSNWIVWN